jgi:hypothetical protein
LHFANRHARTNKERNILRRQGHISSVQLGDAICCSEATYVGAARLLTGDRDPKLDDAAGRWMVMPFWQNEPKHCRKPTAVRFGRTNPSIAASPRRGSFWQNEPERSCRFGKTNPTCSPVKLRPSAGQTAGHLR